MNLVSNTKKPPNIHEKVFFQYNWWYGQGENPSSTRYKTRDNVIKNREYCRGESRSRQ